MTAANQPVPCRRCGRDLATGVATCSACKYPDCPATFLMVYERRRQRSARKAARADVARLAPFGYVPMSGTESWTPGTYSTREQTALLALVPFHAVHVAALLVPATGIYSVRYRRSDLTDEAALAELSGGISWAN